MPRSAPQEPRLAVVPYAERQLTGRRHPQMPKPRALRTSVHPWCRQAGPEVSRRPRRRMTTTLRRDRSRRTKGVAGGAGVGQAGLPSATTISVASANNCAAATSAPVPGPLGPLMMTVAAGHALSSTPVERGAHAQDVAAAVDARAEELHHPPRRCRRGRDLGVREGEQGLRSSWPARHSFREAATSSALTMPVRVPRSRSASTSATGWRSCGPPRTPTPAPTERSIPLSAPTEAVDRLVQAQPPLPRRSPRRRRSGRCRPGKPGPGP